MFVGVLVMKEEGTLNIEYTQTNSSRLILSPNYHGSLNNAQEETEVVISSLPNTFWLNLVYQASIPVSWGGCDDWPLLIHSSSKSHISAKLGCGDVHFNSDVPAGRWCTVYGSLNLNY